MPDGYDDWGPTMKKTKKAKTKKRSAKTKAGNWQANEYDKAVKKAARVGVAAKAKVARMAKGFERVRVPEQGALPLLVKSQRPDWQAYSRVAEKNLYKALVDMMDDANRKYNEAKFAEIKRLAIADGVPTKWLVSYESDAEAAMLKVRP